RLVGFLREKLRLAGLWLPDHDGAGRAFRGFHEARNGFALDELVVAVVHEEPAAAPGDFGPHQVGHLTGDLGIHRRLVREMGIWIVARDVPSGIRASDNRNLWW